MTLPPPPNYEGVPEYTVPVGYPYPPPIRWPSPIEAEPTPGFSRFSGPLPIGYPYPAPIPLDQLPVDILIEIFHRSSVTRLSQLCQASKRMKLICDEDRLWRDKYIRHYGRPPTPPQRPWKTEYISRYSLTHPGTAVSVSIFKPSSGKSRVVAIFKGDYESTYRRLADILNNKIKTNEDLYRALSRAYKHYVALFKKYNPGWGQTSKDTTNPNFNVNEYLALLPITGRTLSKIHDFHCEAGSYDDRDEAVVLDDHPFFLA